MSDTKTELKAWINEINSATTSLQIFNMLEDFRIGNWSDEDRAQIAKVYIAALGRMDTIEFPGDPKLDAPSEETSSAQQKSDKVAIVANADDKPAKEALKIEEEIIDEEVWYEKM
jgi:hypothetical protein